MVHRIVAAVALAIVVLPTPAGAADQQIALLRDRQAGIYTARVSTDCPIGETGLECSQRDTQVEPSIAVNPTDPLNAIAVYQEGRFDGGGAVTNGYATTLDGGRTWTHGHIPGVTKLTGGPYDRASDPVVDFGPDGTAYMNSLVTSEAGPLSMALNVSRDGGRTWEAPTFFAELLASLGVTGVDKNWMVVDRGTGPGHHPGRIYVVWNLPVGVLYAYTDNEGANWHYGEAGFPVHAQGHGVIPLILPNGDLAVVFNTLAYPPNPAATAGVPDALVTKMVVGIARGAGSVPTGAPLVFGPPHPIAAYRGSAHRGQRAGDGLPAAAVDDTSGALYAVWNDSRFRTDDANDIVISRSTDGGITWTAPARVNPPSADYVDHSTPMIGVSPDGTVHVAYRRRRETMNDPSTFSGRIDTIHQASHDAGRTFSAPISVSTVDSDMAFAARSRNGAFLGDYNQIATGGELAYIVRTEPIRVSTSEPRRFPPAYHHQRAWVAVVGPVVSRSIEERPKTKVLGRDLPKTGVGVLPGVVAAAIAALGARALRARRRADDV